MDAKVERARARARAPALLGLAALEHSLLRRVELRHEVAALVGAVRVQRPEALAGRGAHRGVGVGGDGLERAEERPELLERVLQVRLLIPRGVVLQYSLVP